MNSAPSFHIATKLVVLCGQGAAMEVLLAEAGPAGKAQLPQRHVSNGVHPKTQANTWLQSLGFEFSSARLAMLALAGYSTSSNRLSQGVLLWVPSSSKPPGLTWQPLSAVAQFAEGDGALVCAALAQFWPQMPTANPAFTGIQPFASGPDPNGPAIFFGGSFYPWHRAHQACVELCPLPSRVIVVPDNNPQKAHQQRPCAWQTYRHLLARVTPLGAHVFPGYCGLEHANPTVGWFPHTTYQQRHYLMGDDSFASLPKWIDAENLVRACHQLWVVPRRSNAADLKRAAAWLAQVAPACELTFLDDHAYRDVSSTAIRAQEPT